VVLTGAEDAQLHELFMGEELFDRLERTGHIVTRANAQQVFADLGAWLHNTYAGPSLHIVVLTTRCNLDCTYCHMDPVAAGTPRRAADLQPGTADAIITFILDSPRPELTVEFQGGEPFLNFDGLRYFVERFTERNRAAGKRVRFVVVSNLMLCRDEHLAFCRDHGIAISYSLNGPAAVHDAYRVTRGGQGSYGTVMRRLDEIRGRFDGLVNATPLCVVDSANVSQLTDMVDFYDAAGFDGVAIIRLKPLGNARDNGLVLDIHRFMQHYLAALDHIVEKNRVRPRAFVERMVPVVLTKILSPSDVGFVDWRNPCGDVTGAIVYDFDGELLPADEARSLRHEFSLGNVRATSYDALVRETASFRTTNLSIRDREPACRECAYNPYCGVMPVLDFARTGSSEPRAHESDECHFTLGLLDWTFRRLMTNPLPLFRMLKDADRLLLELLDAEPSGP
jgi:radical SAM protein with 4Fe4S-binding SPASM domain